MSISKAISEMGRLAAKLVPKDTVVGLGSGSAVAAFVKALSDKFKYEEVTIIASSLQIELIAEEFGMKVGSPTLVPQVYWAFDGADQVDRHYNLIKGGGGALFRERIILSAAKKRVLLVDESKFVNFLQMPVPVEVSTFARTYVVKRLGEIGGKPTIRANAKAYPILTENGNVVYDVDFGQIREPSVLNRAIRDVPGVIDNGLFSIPLTTVFRACSDGSVSTFEPNKTSD